MQRLTTLATVIALLVFFTVSDSTVAGAAVNLNLNGTATNVIDGDTFDVTATNGTQYRIRLADIDAAERDQAGYTEAKGYLNDLVSGKIVLLDVDDKYVWDDFGTGTRLVCVAYVNHNSTHFLNVNQALVEGANVERKNYDNEFNSNNWSLYVSKDQGVPEFPVVVVLALVAVFALVLAVFLRRNLFGNR